MPVRGLGPVPAAEPLAECTGLIRPGASMHGCTLNWIVRDETGALHVGTAGHCVTGPGQRISAVGVGEFGTVVFAVNAGIGNDYALIAIDADKSHLVSPTLCAWGGPTGPSDYGSVRPHDTLPLPPWLGGGLVVGDTLPVLHYGWGAYTSTTAATRARPGEGLVWDARSVVLLGNYNPGDSGSPVMFADGTVAGIVTHSALAPEVYLGAGLGFATRLDHALALAGAATGHTFTLVTSDDPVLGA